MPDTSPVYRPRKPQDSQYYQCVQDHFETLEQVYGERFAKQYGFFQKEGGVGPNAVNLRKIRLLTPSPRRKPGSIKA